MSSQPPPTGSRRSSREARSSRSKSEPTRWWAVAVIFVLLIGAGFLVASLRQKDNPMAGPTSSSASHANATAAATKATGTPAVVPARSVPVSLRIPSIGVSVSLSKLGLNADGTAQVPTKYEEPGWFKLGPAPGQVGSAVILGHVDDKKGPAVFFRLPTLKAGDKVDVSLADGAVAHFSVKTVEKYLKAQFPAQKVYGSHGISALQLVTCGGTFNTTTGHYESNIVAYTTLVSTTPAGK